ncbi:protein NLP1-like [Phragmites australis]|uniref:protein NLP1-like n=1 Tax=Phragmites australis TaxID=29695 RepID=UPI002D7A2659|nr:protein NLP1-like [Phragmites australis]XP_062209749.1 protein NLP1-like [Phragmites australis]XP_062209750.1 protein NLP1-like [Phragmites australis]XP_062209751.1 protein NLP1-like [Phragmites australis]
MEQAQQTDEDGLLGCGAMEDVAVGDLDLMEELFLAAPGFDFSEFSHPDAGACGGPLSPLFDICSTTTTATPAAPAGEDDRDEPERVDGIDASPPCRGWLFQPRQEAVATVKERLRRALERIASLSQPQTGELLAQVWVPTVIGDRQVLTTCGQPFWLDSRNERLASYRTVSMKYQFSADESSRAELGLPGRVFVGRVPEWTPDVRYFSSEEYPRVRHAQYFDIRGSVALPVFEPRTWACLGVVELVMTTQKINYGAEIENICSALKEVDLRSSDVSSDPRAKVVDTSYRAIVPEIVYVLRTVCERHELPLAQTWIPCICQAKRGSRHSDEKSKYCVSTVDEACYLRDTSVRGFHQACSEHHLFRGEGVVGRAFGTNEPCFSPDITAYSKVQYPLSHHARLFSLRAAVAIRLRSVRTGSLDFVLELFLPMDCVKSEEQRSMLNSLSITIQQTCYTLRVVSLKELVDEGSFETSALTPPECYAKSMHENLDELCSGTDVPARTTSLEASEEVSSWIASLVDAQNKGVKEMDGDLPFGFSKQEDEGFSVTAGWHTSPVLGPEGSIFSGFKQHEEYEVKEETCSRDPSSSKLDKTVEKRRTKMEKTVSLEELRKHFAGSLKEAAKNLGVCPTTLKRICRQHGINRWPSRKIRKVGHSLKKLQMVIDSVHGAEGTVQLSSFYENFTKATWLERESQGDVTYSISEQKAHLEPSIPDRQCEGRFTSHTSGSNSLSPSCSQSSNSSHGCSSGSKSQQHGSAPQLAIKQEVFVEENQSSTLLKAVSHAELQMFTEERPVTLSRPQSQMLLSEQKPMENMSGMQSKPDSLKIKAMYGEERCIFRLQPSWGFEKLKEEIVKRFSIAEETRVDLKYLDDESEWVLLTCDADLLECIDVYKSSSAQTVRILVNPTVQPVLGQTGLS